MSFSRRFDLFESFTHGAKPSFLFPYPPEMVEVELDEQVGFALDVLSPSLICSKSSFFDLSPVHSCFVDSWASDLASNSFLPFVTAVRRAETEIQLQSLSNRIAALEVGFDRAIGAKTEARDRKFKWTAEIKGLKGEDSDRKYRLVAEAKAGGERSVKWSTDVKGKGRYTFEASTAPAAAAGSKKEDEKDKKGEKKKKGTDSSAKLVEIEEEQNPGAVVLRKAFAKKTLANCKGKRKELSPQDAAVLIQVSFKAYLVRQSQVVRSLRELAVAKAKLKEIRSLFNNLSHRRRIARDTEERQRFTEKIIVLLLTVEAIQGADYMIRAAKKSIIDELEMMLEVVDPQPVTGKLGSLKRRKFDLPDSVLIPRELARSVAQVVELIDEHGDDGAEAGASA